ncbi:PREDICTED: uncharacterized protein LOC105364631 [Ceratosolen solmsi marchali]|uniref:Uncharacterized protein LOC105364631 n=1 Tax=Ceratosolen solmsi marchali TaxID=326594 RepID=A0AAJ7DYB4_9HYME|nr:PREDICTED: uncharacterized protein LOC105364631 [Ceratosolen solmsi marchali]
MLAPALWIKKNMLGTYSEELGRPLTEAEIRVQRSLQQLSVPDWFLKYSKPPRILKNATPIECRPASWKTAKAKSTISPRKTPRKKSPKNTPKKTQTANVRVTATPGGLNQTYRITRKLPKKGMDPCISITPSSSGTDSDTPQHDAIPIRSAKIVKPRTPLLRPSNTFPRISPSRKIENINIVFSKPFPTEPSVDAQQQKPQERQQQPLQSNPKTVYTMTKNIEMRREETVSVAPDEADCSGNNHASFLIAEVEPCGVTTRVRVFAGLDDTSEEEEPVDRSTPSPNTRFFNSSKKSTELERMVQNGRRESGSRLIQEIIGELDRSIAEGRSSFGHESLDFARSLIQPPKQRVDSEADVGEEEDDDDLELEDRRCCCSSNSSDSDIAKSTSISYKSSDSEGTTPLPQSEEEDEDVYWIPSKIVQLPRTSSLLSMLSRGSSRSGRTSGRNSPGLSPIRREKPDDWLQLQQQQQQQPRGFGTTYTTRNDKVSRQLFRIDEAIGVIDSGYSDRSGAASSRTATLGRESPSWSLSPSPTLADSEGEGSVKPASKSGSQIHSTLSWCEFAAAYDRAFGEIARN